MKARHSRKYFGRGKGVVAYTLLCNHVPLQGWLIGAHDYEAHHVFDIWYRNTSNIALTAITGDMHSVIANAIVYYNSAILSRLPAMYENSGNEKALALITSTSPVAWRHVHLNGRYAFRDAGQAIDLDTVIRGLNLE